MNITIKSSIKMLERPFVATSGVLENTFVVIVVVTVVVTVVVIPRQFHLMHAIPSQYVTGKLYIYIYIYI